MLNEAVRESLGQRKKATTSLKLRTFSMGVHPHLAYRLPSEIDAELEIEAYLEKERRLVQRSKNSR